MNHDQEADDVGIARGRFRSAFSSHPVLLLLLLTPGIPEYLSGSSAVSAVVLNPPLFLFQVLANLGLYGPGALLVREASVRWNKGWATVLLLGAAYGILEEGVALSTLFNPAAAPVGTLGSYGHWLGVNWVWAAGIVPFHAVFSISLPILLLGLALPETSGVRLLGRRQAPATLFILVLDVLLLMAIVNRASGYWMGLPILAGSLAAIGVLVWAARRASPRSLILGAGPRIASKRALAAVGVSFLPAVFLSQGLAQYAGIPAAADFFLVLVAQALFPAYLAKRTWVRPRGTVALVLGLVFPVALIGAASQLAFPLVLLADLALALFLRSLWRAGPEAGAAPFSPPESSRLQ